uniref:Uncharacterized protein n=1 Tax=Aegilops tauschii subsp. strangulata TaxID=200361 RepID=A0A452ZB37_AEGTS
MGGMDSCKKYNWIDSYKLILYSTCSPLRCRFLLRQHWMASSFEQQCILYLPFRVFLLLLGSLPLCSCIGS